MCEWKHVCMSESIYVYVKICMCVWKFWCEYIYESKKVQI